MWLLFAGLFLLNLLVNVLSYVGLYSALAYGITLPVANTAIIWLFLRQAGLKTGWLWTAGVFIGFNLCASGIVGHLALGELELNFRVSLGIDAFIYGLVLALAIVPRVKPSN